MTIEVRAGRGGDGSASFRREAHVPRGGADGGDGGEGGNVIVRVDPSRRDLASLRRKRKYAAEDGGSGARRKQHGKNGSDIELSVPRGTLVFSEDGIKLADLTGTDERAVIARGGTAGRGNTHFVSSVKRAPAFAEIGLPGEEMIVELRLKLMADAAIVGVPNAGKSSLLRRISNARPKVGSYPFTTLDPVLGTVDRPDGSQIVVVDVPGLLEGASEGHGLGHSFLPHLERARLLVHMVSLEAGPEEAAKNFGVIARELWAYDPRIASFPQIVVLSKLDLADETVAAEAADKVREVAAELDEHIGTIIDVVPLSAATSQGLTDFVNVLFRETADDRDHDLGPATFVHTEMLDDYRVYRPRPKRRRWRIYREKGVYTVTGDENLRQLAERSLTDEEAALELHAWMRDQGVEKAMRMAGAREGTTVTIGGFPFELA